MEKRSRELVVIILAWLLLSFTLIALALPNRTAPGLFYDEVHCAAMARDFLTGHAHPHMVGSTFATVFGRPFPVFYQPYGAAIKSWLLLPSFAVFGATQAVLRMTALSYSLIAVLFFMLWTWRWLGKNTALLAGVLLATDPVYFFANLLDSGLVFPSFLSRLACFGFALAWWRLASGNGPRGKTMIFAFLTGLCAGLCFLSKIDSGVMLGGVVLALVCCDGRALWTTLVRRRPATLALAGLGFLLGAAWIFPNIPAMLQLEGGQGGPVPQMSEKIHTLLRMYDGSYFYRWMDAGGVLTRIFQTSAPVFTLLGIALLLAGAWLLFQYCSKNPAAFLLLAFAFVTVGILLLPDARHLHHMILVYPFPHLVIALAVAQLWRRPWMPVFYAVMIGLQLLAIIETQQLMVDTGGRGWYSDAVTAFARQAKDRPELTIVSLDWGFNEQLAFLTDKPRLVEPIWEGPPPTPRLKDVIYLVHPSEYCLVDYGLPFLEKARHLPGARIIPWRDHQGGVVFYSVQFLRP